MMAAQTRESLVPPREGGEARAVHRHAEPRYGSTGEVNATSAAPSRQVRRRLPPFGRRVLAAMATLRHSSARPIKGRSPDKRHWTLWVCLGHDAWSVARELWAKGWATMVLPEGADPGSYDWLPALGNDVLVRPSPVADGNQVKALVYELVAAGVDLVVMTDRHGVMGPRLDTEVRRHG